MWWRLPSRREGIRKAGRVVARGRQCADDLAASRTGSAPRPGVPGL